MNTSHCILEDRFPHIIQNLVGTWSDDPLSYLDSLTIDRRGGRQGFPPEAMSEILFLSDLHWWRTHEDASEADLQAEIFSFAAQ